MGATSATASPNVSNPGNHDAFGNVIDEQEYQKRTLKDSPFLGGHWEMVSSESNLPFGVKITKATLAAKLDEPKNCIRNEIETTGSWCWCCPFTVTESYRIELTSENTYKQYSSRGQVAQGTILSNARVFEEKLSNGMVVKTEFEGENNFVVTQTVLPGGPSQQKTLFRGEFERRV